MIRLFHKLSHLDHDRLLWKVFNYDYEHPYQGSWCYDVKAILNEANLSDIDDLS